MRVVGVGVASHGQASSVMRMRAGRYSVRMTARTCGHVRVICPELVDRAAAERHGPFVLPRSCSTSRSAHAYQRHRCRP
jgi:hypothetical protein